MYPSLVISARGDACMQWRERTRSLRRASLCSGWWTSTRPRRASCSAPSPACSSRSSASPPPTLTLQPARTGCFSGVPQALRITTWLDSSGTRAPATSCARAPPSPLLLLTRDLGIFDTLWGAYQVHFRVSITACSVGTNRTCTEAIPCKPLKDVLALLGTNLVAL
jgi:hypothetical protein